MVIVSALVLAGCTVFGGTASKTSVSPAAPSPVKAKETSPVTRAAGEPAAQLPAESPIPSPAPLTREAVLSCPVSLPNLAESPDEYFLSAEDGYGNPEQTIFIGLWPVGKVVFYPGGPGHIGPDGSLSMKFWFYRTIEGEVVFEGRRLDAPAPPMPGLVLRGEEDGYGERGFQPAGLVFTTEGCWEVTARIGAEQMTFVTLVARVPFEPLLPAWLPEGLSLADSDLTGLPGSFRQVYGSTGKGQGELIIETAQDEPAPSGETQQEPAPAGELQGACAPGVEDQIEQAGLDGVVLEWARKGLRYRISQNGLGLSCADIQRVAGLEQGG
jgi:hypothetical protein